MEDYIKPKEAARRLSVTVQTIYNYFKDGLKSKKINGVRRIKESDLEQYIEDKNE